MTKKTIAGVNWVITNWRGDLIHEMKAPIGESWVIITLGPVVISADIFYHGEQEQDSEYLWKSYNGTDEFSTDHYKKLGESRAREYYRVSGILETLVWQKSSGYLK